MGCKIESNLVHIPPNLGLTSSIAITAAADNSASSNLRCHYQSLLTFPNLFYQSNTCRIEESEIYHNNKGDIAD